MSPQQILWILWTALLASLGIYAAIALLGIGVGPAGSSGAVPLLAECFGLVAAIQGVLTFVLRRRLLERPFQEGRLAPTSPEGAGRVQAVYVVLWSLSEAVAIYGLVLWLLSQRWDLFLPFLLGGALLLVLHAPRAGRLAPARTLDDLAAGRSSIG